jgi:hypothetical protein
VPSAHAYLSPSAAHRWLVCPGSARLEASVPERSSPDADLGTLKHKALESWLNNGEHINLPTEEDRLEVVSVFSWVMARAERYKATIYTEEKAKVGAVFNCPDALWGTADVVLVSTNRLEVVDAKFGHGAVQVEDNPQLLLYLLGLDHEFGGMHEELVITIAQPKTGAPTSAVYTRAHLDLWAIRFATKVKAALDLEAPLVPSEDGCRWCAAAAVCPALQAETQALAQREFQNPSLLPREGLLHLLNNAGRIRAALDAVEAHALDLILAGTPLPGWKVVAGKKHRVWRDEEKAKSLLQSLGYQRKDMMVEKMITPAQAEKLVGKATAPKLAPYVETPEGGPVLVRDADARPHLDPAADFNALTEGLL